MQTQRINWVPILCVNINFPRDAMLKFDVIHRRKRNVGVDAMCEQTFSHQEYRFGKNTGALWHFAGPFITQIKTVSITDRMV